MIRASLHALLFIIQYEFGLQSFALFLLSVSVLVFVVSPHLSADPFAYPHHFILDEYLAVCFILRLKSNSQ